MFLDTNVIIRHLTGDPSEMAERATSFLASPPELLMTDLVVAEAVYVLESVHQVASFDRSLDRILSIERIEPGADGGSPRRVAPAQ
jgi:predicted nucleic acid-binding protein